MDREVKKVNEIVKNHNWIFKPCPMCGSKDIGVKDTIIDAYFEKDSPAVARRKIWAYCRYCGATCGHTVADIIGDDEEIAAAIEKWNSRTPEEKSDILKLPNNATNGDVIKAIFGAEVIQKTNTWIETDIDGNTVFNLSWWNSPYEGEKNDNGNAGKKTEQTEVIKCKDCKHFEYDVVAKVDGARLIVGHEMCHRWGDGCKTEENGFCFLAEAKQEE